MGCAQSTDATDEYIDRNVHTSTNKRLVFGLKFGRGDQGGMEAKVLGGYESGFRRVYDSDTGSSLRSVTPSGIEASLAEASKEDKKVTPDDIPEGY